MRNYVNHLIIQKDVNITNITGKFTQYFTRRYYPNCIIIVNVASNIWYLFLLGFLSKMKIT